MKKRILVTGGAGRIASAFVDAFRDAYDFVRIDRRPVEGDPDAGIVADLTDLAALERAATGCQAMVHLGAHPNHHPDYPGVIVPSNLIGLHNAYEAAARAGVGKVVFASTVQTEFGWPEGTKVSVEMPARPTNYYSASKVFGEHLGYLYSRDRGLSVICLRFGGVSPPERERDMLEDGHVPEDIALLSSDCVEIIRRAVEVEGVPFAVVPAYSRNAEKIKDLEPLKRILGYEPRADARELLKQPEDPAVPKRKMIRDAFRAAESGDPAALAALLDADPRIANHASRGIRWWDGEMRPLHYAARRGRLECLTLLLERGADPQAPGGRMQRPAIYHAATGGHREAAALLRERGGDATDAFVASGLGELDRLAAILDADPAQAKAANAQGVTPLHLARTPEVARLLLDRGADPDARDQWRKQTPVVWTLERPDVARAIAERAGRLDFILACALGDEPAVRDALDRDPALANAESTATSSLGAGRRPLHLAVARNHVALARVLLSKGADPNAFDHDGGGALHVAAWHARLELIPDLIAAGAKLDLADPDWGATPKDWANYADSKAAIPVLEDYERKAAESAKAGAASRPAPPIRRVLVTGGTPDSRAAFGAAATGFEIAGDGPADALVHLPTPAPAGDWDAQLESGLLGLWRSLELARSARIRRYVLASSDRLYAGWPLGMPVDPEKTPLRPADLGGAVAAHNEVIAATVAKRGPFELKIVRLPAGADPVPPLLAALK